MRSKKLFGLATIVVLFVGAGVVLVFMFLFWDREDGEIVVAPDGTETVIQEPVKGPNPGESGNDFDNTFRSLTVSPTDPDLVYIGNEGNGIFRSKDGGETWEWLRTGLRHQEGRYPEVYDMAIDVNNEAVVLAATTNGPSPILDPKYDVPVTAGIYRSEEGGDLWVQYLDGLPNSAVVSLVQYPGESDTFVIGLDGLEVSRDPYRDLDTVGGLYITHDGGKSWEALPIPEEGIQNRYAKLKVRGEDEPILYTSGVKWTEVEGSSHSEADPEGSIGLLRGEDDGQTWTKINPAEDAFVLYFDVSEDGKTIYAGDLDEGRMFVSDDRGETWETLNFGGTGPLKIFPGGKEKVLFGMGNELYITEDGFQSQKKVLTLKQGVNDIEFFEADPEIVYVSGGGIEVYKSTDGGETFEKMVDLREFIDNSE